MKKDATPLVDDHLNSLKGMKEAFTDEFFYTRLKARMEAYNEVETSNGFTLRPVWAIGILAVLFVFNSFILNRQSKNEPVETSHATTIQQFAQSYDQTLSTY